MPAFDATALAHLDNEPVIKPAFFVFLDFLGDPMRATTAGHAITLAGTGDADLDGDYAGIDSQVIDVGEVMHQEGGSDTVTITLSGQLLPDAELLAAIGDAANWQGRLARLWLQIRDADNVEQGAVAHYYTGYMSSVEIVPTPKSQMILLRIEGYMASTHEASNRTWLGQSRFDAADTSASGTLAAANNARSGQGAAAGYSAPSASYW